MATERKNGNDETDFVKKPTNNTEVITTSMGCKLFENSTKHLTKLENMHIFNSFPYRKKSSTPPVVTNCSAKGDDDVNLILKNKPKPFVKSASIAKLFGNNYSTKKNETNQLILHQQSTLNNTNNNNNTNSNTNNSLTSINNNNCNSNSSNKVKVERFYQKVKCEDMLEDDTNFDCVNENSNATTTNIKNSNEQDLSLKAIRTLSRGLGKLLRRRSNSVNISEPDPEFKVVYLGNVLTGWAKGEGCVDKPLATLWRNYTQNSKPDVVMKIRVCSSGLKATTKQHGLTEYWSHRITYCAAPKNYPRIFCWVYRHEGRKLKNEMRCHAVLCAKNLIAQEIGKKLQENIARALCEFKRDKISRQNARLSLVNSVYENPSMPRRKILLSVGGNNYRPPLERSKSAPKLMAIEEIIGEEDEFEEDDDPNVNSIRGQQHGCENGLKYSTMTLGRRRGSRGSALKRRNSVRRSKQFQKTITFSTPSSESNKEISTTLKETENDYDFTVMEPLEGEIMSYYDMKLKSNLNSTSFNNLDEIECNTKKELMSESSKLGRNSQSMDDLDGTDNVYHNEIDPDSHVFFNQNDILDIIRKHTLSNMNTPESAVEPDYLDNSNANNGHMYGDETSVSSGCETISLMTVLNENDSLVVVEPLNNTSSTRHSFKSHKQYIRSITYPLDDDLKQQIFEDNPKIFIESQDSIHILADNNSRHVTYDDEKSNILFSHNIKRQNLNFDSRARGGCLNENITDTDINNLRTLCIDDGNDGNVSEYSDESGYVEETHEQIEKNKMSTNFSEFVVN